MESGTPNVVGVYERVSFFEDWIAEHADGIYNCWDF